MLVTVSASLFVVAARRPSATASRNRSTRVVAIEADLLADQITEQAQIEQKVKNLIASIVDDGGFVLVQGPRGAIRIVAGSPSSTPVPVAGSYGRQEPDRNSQHVGRQAIRLRRAQSQRDRRTEVPYSAVPDTSAQQALGDLFRVLLIIVLVLLIVGISDRLAAVRGRSRDRCGGWLRRLADLPDEHKREGRCRSRARPR